MRAHSISFSLIAALAVLSACGDVPELMDATSARAIAADYPALVDIDTLLASGQQTRVNEQTGADMSARVDNLRNRANRLRRSVIEPARRRALQEAVSTQQ